MPRDPEVRLQDRWVRYYAYFLLRDQLPVVLALAYRKNRNNKQCTIAWLPRELLLMLVRAFRATPKPSRLVRMGEIRMERFVACPERFLLFKDYIRLQARQRHEHAIKHFRSDASEQACARFKRRAEVLRASQIKWLTYLHTHRPDKHEPARWYPI